MTSETAIVAVVGLGNPGPRYAGTRHNIGFMVVDELARRATVAWHGKFKADVGRGQLRSTELWFLKPQSFMNLSGDPVQRFCAFYKLRPEQLLVIHDEIELSFGEVRPKESGGHGGHNGLRSMIDRLGNRAFKRLRIGVGRPLKGDPGAHVLSQFSVDERAVLDDLVAASADVVETIATQGMRVAMKQTNHRVIA